MICGFRMAQLLRNHVSISKTVSLQHVAGCKQLVCCYIHLLLSNLPPVFIPKKGRVNTQRHKKQRHRSQCPWEPKAPKKIPPEAMKEYAEIMEDLLGLAYSATGEPNGKQKGDNEQQQEEHDIYTDPGLLNYIDKLCSQEAFVTKVGWTWKSGVYRFYKFRTHNNLAVV